MTTPPELPENPYQSPTEVAPEYAYEVNESSILLAEPNACSTGAGIDWLKQAFQIYKERWLLWTAIGVGFIFIVMFMNVIPIVNIVAGFFTLHFMGGMILGCRDQVEEDNLTFGHLFQAFSTHLVPLLIVYLLYFIMIIVVMIPAVILFAIFFGAAIFSGDPESLMSGSSWIWILVGVLVLFALMIPPLMAVWFAPALVVLHDVEPMDAMKMSFKGCKKNLMTFLVYSIVAIFVSILVAIFTLGIGLLALLPVFYITYYTSYLDVWTEYSL